MLEEQMKRKVLAIPLCRDRELTMQLEDYFDFQRPDDIRLKGTRVGIETILYDFIHRSRTPEEIAQTYPSLTLEQVYATILYYLHNKEAVSKYLADWLEWGHQQRKAQELNPPPGIIRLRKLRAEQEAQKKQLNEYQNPIVNLPLSYTNFIK
jgi:uncharacterized protein (DUF433 family)